MCVPAPGCCSGARPALAFLAGNNLLLVADLVVFPSLDLRLARLLLALAAVAVYHFRLHLEPGGRVTAMTLYDFLSGFVSCGFVVAGLFFLRFWKRSGDSLFIWFAVAFWLLGAGQALLALGNIPVEERSSIYLIRLAAFLLILFAIVRKNRARV